MTPDTPLRPEALQAIRERVDSCAAVNMTRQAAQIVMQDIPALLATITALQQENSDLRARAVAAEHHKALCLLGKSSYQELVEEQLRTQLAETQVRAEAAEAQLAQVQQERDEARQKVREVQAFAKKALECERAALRETLEELSALTQQQAALREALAEKLEIWRERRDNFYASMVGPAMVVADVAIEDLNELEAALASVEERKD